MRDKILDRVDKDVATVDGTVLAVVQYPFYLDLHEWDKRAYIVIYLASNLPVQKELEPAIEKGFYSAYHELDEWMSHFISCQNWALWPVMGEGVVDVLYRDQQFGELALHATECVSLRFFEDRLEYIHEIYKTIRVMENGILSMQEATSMIKPLVVDLATAIHFARTGDVETNYNVLKQHFNDGSHNLIEITEIYPLNVHSWIQNIEEKIKDLTAELKGAIVCSKIDWETDLEKLLKLGQLAMELRQLA